MTTRHWRLKLSLKQLKNSEIRALDLLRVNASSLDAENLKSVLILDTNLRLTAPRGHWQMMGLRYDTGKNHFGCSRKDEHKLAQLFTGSYSCRTRNLKGYVDMLIYLNAY